MCIFYKVFWSIFSQYLATSFQSSPQFNMYTGTFLDFSVTTMIHQFHRQYVKHQARIIQVHVIELMYQYLRSRQVHNIQLQTTVTL